MHLQSLLLFLTATGFCHAKTCREVKDKKANFCRPIGSCNYAYWGATCGKRETVENAPKLEYGDLAKCKKDADCVYKWNCCVPWELGESPWDLGTEENGKEIV